MTIDYNKLRNRKFSDVEQTYGARDAILYALAVGYGADPTDTGQLRFVYEKNLTPAPTFPLVLGSPGFWLNAPDTGVDWVRAVHAEQGIALHMPLKAEGRIVGRTKITGIVDKGKDKGALLLSERNILDRDSGATIATLSSSTLCRGDGGFGGSDGPAPLPHPIPDDPPHLSCSLGTDKQAALLYRLCGDNNPLHADPAVAKAAGFPRPILHGLCTLGVAAHAVLRMLCDYDPTRLQSIRTRFSAPVYPGETIRTDMWINSASVSFRSWVVERDVMVLNNGLARLSSAATLPTSSSPLLRDNQSSNPT